MKIYQAVHVRNLIGSAFAIILASMELSSFAQTKSLDSKVFNYNFKVDQENSITIFEADESRKSCTLQSVKAKSNRNNSIDLKQLLQQCYEELQSLSENAWKDGKWNDLIGYTNNIIEIKEFVRATPNNISGFGGIGIEILKKENEYPIIRRVIPGHQASRAGIKTGAIITRIDDQDTRHLSNSDIVEKLRGRDNTIVRIKYEQSRLSKKAVLTRKTLKESLNNDISIFWQENIRLNHAYIKLAKWKEALLHYPVLLKSIVDKHGNKYTLLAQYYLEYATLLNENKNYKESNKYLSLARSMQFNIDLKPEQKKYGLDALALSNYINLNNLETSEKYIKKIMPLIISERSKLSNVQVGGFIRDVSLFLNSGYCQPGRLKINQACKNFASTIYDIVKSDPKEYSNEIFSAYTAYQSILWNSNNTDRALEVLDELISLLASYRAERTSLIISALNMKAPYLNLLGRHLEAEIALQQVLQFTSKTFPTTPSEDIEARLNLAKHFALINQRKQAFLYFEDILEKLATLPTGEKEDELRYKVYYSYLDASQQQPINSQIIGEIKKDIQRIANEHHNDPGTVAIGKLLFARIALLNESISEATQFIRSYLANLRKYRASQIKLDKLVYAWDYIKLDVAESRAYADLSALFLVQDDIKLAREYIKKAISISQRLEGTIGEYNNTDFLYQSAQIDVATGDLKSATKSLRSSLQLAISKGKQGLNDQSRGARSLGAVMALQKQYQAASSYFNDYLQVTYKQLVSSLWQAPAEQKKSILESSYLDSNVVFWNYGDSPSLNDSALTTQINLYSLAKEIEIIQASDNRSVNSDMIYQLRSLKVTQDGTQFGSADYNRISDEINQLETKLINTTFKLGIDKPINAAELRRYIPVDSSLIVFKRYSTFPSMAKTYLKSKATDLYVAFIMSPNGRVQRVELGTAAEIDKYIRSALRATAQNAIDSRSLLADLSQKIFGTLSRYISTTAHIIIVPDSAINLAPFHALLGISKDINLAQKRLTVLGTIRELTKNSNQDSRWQAPAVFANPDFGTASETAQTITSKPLKRSASSTEQYTSISWPILSGTELEGKAVAKLLGVKVVLGSNASTREIKKLISPLILHIASHGFSDEESHPSDRSSTIYDKLRVNETTQNLLSGIVLAGANVPNQKDDGIISTSEASSLNLTGTELVVLSACTTALGSLNPGDGIFGLQRAFSIAGARSTLLSLWKVDDAATAEFMQRYYQRLKAGEGRSNALAAVQQDFRSGKVQSPTGADWKEPYYWAAWQLVGDWRPIKGL